jgi:hypothetical protein
MAACRHVIIPLLFALPVSGMSHDVGFKQLRRLGISPDKKGGNIVHKDLPALWRPFFMLLREVVWVILDQFRMAVFFCSCRCGHVGNALALSIMSTALLDARAVDL